MRLAGSWVNESVAELALLQPFQANEFTCGFQVFLVCVCCSSYM